MAFARSRFVLILSLLLAAVGAVMAADWWSAAPHNVQIRYVGRQSCAQCHATQMNAHAGSHHDLAQDLATEETVLGDFSDVEFTYQGVTSRMFRRKGKFLIHTEGADGKLADFEVTHVIGVTPLQQYLIALPDGRFQVSRISWDTEAKRWFYVYPPDVTDERILPHDPLHWTKRTQNWNHMCAECHATNLQKNYDAGSNEFHTTHAEFDVSCEACHGPASLHVELAESNSLFWDRNHGFGLTKLKTADSKAQVESCAFCHARRSLVATDWRPGNEYLDHWRPSLLVEPLYHADGQILDEVYVYGSFAQSKMHAKNVRCSDCHDPHTAELKQEGNTLCTSCHQHPTAKYDTPSHHQHKVGSTGASCVECHMPERHYMVVDPRRDHSLRVPRPDLSVKLGTPNACTGCHLETDKLPELPHYEDWLMAAGQGNEQAAAEIAQVDQKMLGAVRRWYGRETEETWHYAEAFAAARAGKPEGEALLIRIVKRRSFPDIVRATAAWELSRYASREMLAALRGALQDDTALVRMAAVSAFGRLGIDRTTLRDDLAPLLDDSVRAVRIEAARLLSGSREMLGGQYRDDFDVAIAEYIAAQEADHDRPESLVNLGSILQNEGDSDGALASFAKAAELAPDFTPARLYAAMVLQQRGRLPEAEQHLVAIVKAEPTNADAYHWLGIVLARQEKYDAGLAAIKRSLELVPEYGRYQEALLALCLDRGKFDEAEAIVGDLIQMHPEATSLRNLRNLIQQARQRKTSP